MTTLSNRNLRLIESIAVLHDAGLIASYTLSSITALMIVSRQTALWNLQEVKPSFLHILRSISTQNNEESMPRLIFKTYPPQWKLSPLECLEHRKKPSSFPKDELHIAKITTPQVLVPSPCSTIAWQRWWDLNFSQWLQSMGCRGF